LGRHAGVQVRHERRERREQHEPVQAADQRSDPPGRSPELREQEVVDEREQPAAQPVEHGARRVRRGPLPREHGPDQERQREARVAEALAAEENRSLRPRRDEAPEHDVDDGLADVGHVVRYAVLCEYSACAAEIMLTCVNACGKLPTGLPVDASISSAYSSTSLAQPSSRSNSASASLRRPQLARYSAAQKLHGANTFSWPRMPS